MAPTTRSMAKINSQLNIMNHGSTEEMVKTGRVFYKMVQLDKQPNRHYTVRSNMRPAIAWLYIPETVGTNLGRKLDKNGNPDFAKHRAEKAYVIQLTDLAGNKLSREKIGYSCFGGPFNSIIYIPGTWVYPDEYERDIWQVCAKGIHFYKTIEACLAFLADPDHLYYGTHYYKPFLPDGTYNRYSDDGQISSQSITYKNGILVRVDDRNDTPSWFNHDMKNTRNYYERVLNNDRCDEVERRAFEKYLVETQ